MRLRLAALAICLAAPAFAGAPERVVSMHLCADQLALMLAAPGQLVSVSHWATRPSASNLAEAAAALPANHGLAEQVFLMEPDLVLAGPFNDRVAVEMLRRLGVRVRTIPQARSMRDVSENIRRVGAALGREEAADALVAEFEAALAAEAARAVALPGDRAAYHYPNNYTSGANTLASEVLETAGFENAAAALGFDGAARVALETLVMARPFLVRTEHISATRRGRSYESARHPALAALGAEGRSAAVAERWQVCGTPFVARAVAALVDARLGAGPSSAKE